MEEERATAAESQLLRKAPLSFTYQTSFVRLFRQTAHVNIYTLHSPTHVVIRIKRRLPNFHTAHRKFFLSRFVVKQTDD